MTGPAARNERRFMPEVTTDLPAGERAMIAVLRAVPEHEQNLAAAIGTLAAAVRREPGCVEFRSFRDSADVQVFYLYEIYADVDAFRRHLDSPHVAHFYTELAEHSSSDAAALTQLIELNAARPTVP